MLPANQCLVARDVSTGNMQDGLQLHVQLIALEGIAQLAFQANLVEGMRVLLGQAARLLAGVSGQGGQCRAVARKLTHQQRAHDGIGRGETFGKLVAVDGGEHAVAQGLRAGGTR